MHLYKADISFCKFLLLGIITGKVFGWGIYMEMKKIKVG
jgi:hypothetical protein